MKLSEFRLMPEISEEAKTFMQTAFTPYLFFETVKRGVRKYTCTACGEVFETDERVLKRTFDTKETALWHAGHNDYAECPHCGKKEQVKNIKKCKTNKLNQDKYVCIFLSNAPDDVWIRCFKYYRNYRGDTYYTAFKELMRYHLTPGNAEMWELYSGEWYKKNKFGEAFLWNHGCWCEKYVYSVYEDNMKIEDTFLKYHSFYSYEGCHGYGLPAIKYLCWYAVHPQIEMLVKLGLYKTVDEMIFKNTDDKSMLDWKAQKPWELHRLPRQLYNYWLKKCYGDMRTLKIFKALKGKSEKDFKAAEQILNFSSRKLGNAKKLCSFLKQSGRTYGELIRYLEKVSRNSAGACHHCPGITVDEAYNMWADYLDMAKKSGVKNISTFPADLKAAHDSFITAANISKNKQNAKKLRDQAKQTADGISKRFPKVDKIYKKLAAKYEYTNGTYSIIIPNGVEDIVLDAMVLAQCTFRTDRYYERISSNESYIFFLRHADKPDIPWYTLEVEPGGTVRQKRTTGDDQLSDLTPALPFITEWQQVVQERLNANDRKLAKRSKILRNEGFEELRKSGKRINYGRLSGQKLIDALEQDLMEAETA